MSDFFKCQGVTKSKTTKASAKASKPQFTLKNLKMCLKLQFTMEKQNCFKCRVKDNKFSDASN